MHFNTTLQPVNLSKHPCSKNCSLPGLSLLPGTQLRLVRPFLLPSRWRHVAGCHASHSGWGLVEMGCCYALSGAGMVPRRHSPIIFLWALLSPSSVINLHNQTTPLNEVGWLASLWQKQRNWSVEYGSHELWALKPIVVQNNAKCENTKGDMSTI